ncbi:hypothetical protein C8Q76DRAFT_788972 [Earliella scabrosa]|nr:hypothetical protein C8Q76DRAFT_788972 [Earliella scabrosa]
MAQRPSNHTPYTFGARVLVRRNYVTDLVYSAAVAPDFVGAAEMTITRRFHDDPALDGKMDMSDDGQAPVVPPATRATTPLRKFPQDPSAHIPVQSSSSSSSTTTPRSSTSRSRSTTPALPDDDDQSPPEPQTTPSRTSPAPSTQQTHTRKTSSSRRPLKRSSVRTTFRVEPVPPSTPSVPSTSTYVHYEDDDIRRQYKRDYKICSPTDEEKRLDVRYDTAWFYSNGNYSLSAPPPAMAKHPELKLGDIFFHCAPHLQEPQMWVWMERAGGQPFWTAVYKGDVRPEDDRKLAIGQDDDGLPKPNWVTHEWYRKLGYKERQAARKSKGKAKAKAKARE